MPPNVEGEERNVQIEEETAKVWYPSTANPQDKRNIELHRNRFRATPSPGVEYFNEMYKSDEWRANHVPLDELPITHFHIHHKVQQMIYKIQSILVDQPYNTFGKVEGSWDNYTLMFRNGWSSVGDLRKPVASNFQQYCEDIYVPIMCCMLFGKGWEDIKQHWGSFKSCTIKVCEGDQNFLGDNVFHMHIDGKVGLLQERNYSQRHMSRLLFSIVTDVLEDEDAATAEGNGTTVYPIWQPKRGFSSNQAFHKYMQSKYHECGLKNSGLPRPHYRIPEELVYRAVSGEVLFHFTHSSEKNGKGPQAIHSEPNPCPDRHLFVFDWNNIVQKDESGKYLPSTEVPESEIIGHMLALSACDTAEYQERLQNVKNKANELLSQAEKYPGGAEIIAEMMKEIDAVLLQ
mmetsp:Transcript_2724/g.3347  ORF Transcript_2724/g.3347 Transcript_2724/m.3347 type:complete len:402 (-) Transcript_2724:60-1265(-)